VAANHVVGNPFCHFQCFYSLTALLKEFNWFYDIFLFLYTFLTKDFVPAEFFFAVLARTVTKICFSVIAQTRMKVILKAV
jgi:hypothetical protein